MRDRVQYLPAHKNDERNRQKTPTISEDTEYPEFS